MIEMEKRILGLIVLTSFLLTSSYAYEVSINPIKDQGSPGDQLRYQIQFKNNESYEERVKFNIFNWEPKSDQWRVNLNPGEEEKVDFNLTIPEEAEDGNTVLFLYTWSQNTDETEKLPIRARISSEDQPLPISIESIHWSKEIDPRNNLTIKAKIESKSRRIREMRLRYEIMNNSNTVLVEETEGEILPLRNETINFNVKLSPKTPPQTLTQRFDLFVEGAQMEKREEVLTIKGYKDLKVKKETDTSLFGKSVEFSVSNNGTISASKTLKTELSFFEKLFISSKEGKIKKENLVFEMDIGAGAEKTVGYQINYAPLLTVPFIAIALGYGVYYFTRKAKIKKRLIEKKTEDKFEAKVEISFKNLSGTDLKNVKVIDGLPSFINKVGGFGTLRPQIKGDGNKKLVWRIGKVDEKEERILSYKVKSEMGIVGKVEFPSAKLAYEYKGEDGEVHSNKLRIGSIPQLEKEEEQ